MSELHQRFAEPPNLVKARAYTRVLGPAAMLGGSAAAIIGTIMWMVGGGVLATIIIAYGIICAIFGTAAWARTESVPGIAARWAVVAIFLGAGGLALLQWAQLLWGSRMSTASMNTDLTFLGFYLMAGPALLVPGLLAAIRPAWVPLIVAPAIIAMAATAVVGLSVITMMGVGVPASDPAANTGIQMVLMIAAVIASALVVLWPMIANNPGLQPGDGECHSLR